MSLCSGGTTVTVTGNSLDAAAQPVITVTVVVTRLNSTDDDAPTARQTTVTSEVSYFAAHYDQRGLGVQPTLHSLPFPV